MTDHRIPSQKTPPQTDPQTVKAEKEAIRLSLRQKMARFFGWPFWAVVVMMSFGMIGYVATSTLLSMNNYKNCDSVYWPFASGSMRLYCAQVEAKDGDADSLLKAISLVSELPQDHPLRNEIDKNIKLWSEQVLELGEQYFQAGKFEKAIEVAEKIPSSVAAQEVVDEKLQRWRSTQKKAQAIQKQIEQHLMKANWNLAYDEAEKLVELDNNYLANDRYMELLDEIERAQAEGEQLEKARDTFARGSVDNLLTALEQAQEIGEDSYSYKGAQQLITDIGDQLEKKAHENLDNRNWDRLLEIANAIPASLDLDEKVRDFRRLALAGSQAERDTIAGFESAIAQAETLSDDQPLYQEAQSLISRWETQITDLKTIAEAKEAAQGSQISDFREAIATAREIPSGNPRYNQAQQLINEWTREIQIIEDRPILNRAKELARGNNISDYQAAIEVASQIGSNRALYNQARDHIQRWRAEKQRLEDRPILLEAERLASRGELQAAIEKAQEIGSNRALYNEARNHIQRWRAEKQRREDRPILLEAERLAERGRLQAAIEKAQEIGSNRALYNEARQKIRNWRTDQNARESLQKAHQFAEAETAQALERAIETAASARNSDTYRAQAEQKINEWSEKMYVLATHQADRNNLKAAIEIARSIPSYSGSYGKARQSIQQWQSELQQQRQQQQQEAEEASEEE